MSYTEELGQTSRTRVIDALKRSLEGELVDIAYAPSRFNLNSEGHSKTGVANHSKEGHQHSKYTSIRSANLDPVEDAKYLKFAENLARVKSTLDDKD
jgi:hypothetical protein